VATKPSVIPGIFRLAHIRKVVESVNMGVTSSALIGVKSGIATRQVSFATSAAKMLGWIKGDVGDFEATSAGRALLETIADTKDEADHLKRAIERSTDIQAIAPSLLAPRAPSFKALSKSLVEETGISEVSAQRGARALLVWRKQALFERPRGRTERAMPASRDAAPGLPLTPPRRAPLQEVLAPQVRVARLRELQLRGFGALTNAKVELGDLTVLIGELGAGKTAPIDALLFLAAAQRFGLSRVFAESGLFPAAIALEVELSSEHTPAKEPFRARYELELETDGGGAPRPRREALFLEPTSGELDGGIQPSGRRQVFGREQDQTTRFQAEVGQWETSYTLDPDRLALSQVPADATKFLIALQVKTFIASGVSRLLLQGRDIPASCSATGPTSLTDDVKNLLRAIHRLELDAPDSFDRWLEWLRRAIPWLMDVHVSQGRDDASLSLDVTLESGRVVRVEELSPELLHTIALITLPFTLGPGEVVHIDDTSLALPPATLATIASCWSRAHRGGQIIVTTASPLWAVFTPLKQLRVVKREESGDCSIVKGQGKQTITRWRRAVDLAALR
jgi:predicted ATPase